MRKNIKQYLEEKWWDKYIPYIFVILYVIGISLGIYFTMNTEFVKAIIAITLSVINLTIFTFKRIT